VLEPELRASRLHTGLTIKMLMADPDARAILSRHVGGFLLMGDMSMAGDMTLTSDSESSQFCFTEIVGTG